MSLSKALITWLLALVITFAAAAAAAAVPSAPKPVPKPGVLEPAVNSPVEKHVVNIAKPDLVVSKVTFTPANPTTAEEIYILIEVKNQGTVPADFPGGTFWEASLPGGGGIGGSKNPCSIAPGETVTGGGRLAASGKLAAGTYAVRVVADPENKVAEANETNNESSYNLVVADGGPVDLTISDIQAQPVAGSTNRFKVTVTIKNNGAPVKRFSSAAARS